MVGYGRQPDYELFAPGQLTREQRLAYAMKHNEVLRQAQKEEGLDPDEVPDIETLATPQVDIVRGRL